MTEDKKKEIKETEGKIKPRIRIKIKAYDHKIIDQSTRTIIDTAKRSGAKVIGPVPLPTEKKKFTTQRSTFVPREATCLRVHSSCLLPCSISTFLVDFIFGVMRNKSGHLRLPADQPRWNLCELLPLPGRDTTPNRRPEFCVGQPLPGRTCRRCGGCLQEQFQNHCPAHRPQLHSGEPHQ